MRWLLALQIAVVSVFLSGCAGLQSRDGLEISLVNARLSPPTVWETQAQFTVRIINERPEPVVVDGSVHRIHLNGAYVGEGVSNERLEVPRLGSATQEITVYLRNVRIATRLRSIVDNQAVDYKVDSTLYLANDGRSRRCRVAQEGHLALADFQPSSRNEPK
jgi:LEA14-like dessication related protein